MSLEDLIKFYKTLSIDKGINNELEIRFKNTTRESFVSAYTNALNDLEFDSIEQSINAIIDNIPGSKNDHFTQYIRSQIFKEGIKISDTYHRKASLKEPLFIKGYLDYSINISKETVINKFAVPINAIIRLKNRASFTHEGWRFDFTLVKKSSLETIGPSLQKIKDVVFTHNTKDTFIKTDADIITEYSIELEYIGNKDELNVKSFLVVDKLFSLENPTYLNNQAYDEELLYLAKYLVKNDNRLKNFKNISIKKISNQAVVLTKNLYKTIFPPTNYYLTDKADGKRCIISILGNRCRIISDTLQEFTILELDKMKDVTIADGELIESDNNLHIYLFDVMVYVSTDLTEKPFRERLEYLAKTEDIIKKYLPNNSSVNAKKFIKLEKKDNTFKEQFNTVFNAKYPYIIDGLILTSPNENYIETTSYKWKPVEHNTIDFLAKKIPPSLLGKKPFIAKSNHTLYALFCGISYQMFHNLGLIFMPRYDEIISVEKGGQYFPIQFSPSLDPYAYIYNHQNDLGDIDGKIIELRKENDIWLFVRLRIDRIKEPNYFGNDFQFAESTYQNYFSKFSLEDLSDPSFGYFAESDSVDSYKANRIFNRMVINKIFEENITSKKWIIDLASGRGADIHRYMRLGIANILAIEKDPESVSEIIHRKFEYSHLSKDKKHTPSILHTLIQDLKEPAETIIDALEKYNVPVKGIETIVCNFALHYFCDSQQNIRNILRLVSKLLKMSGIFIFTVLDGRKTFKLLNKLGIDESWKIIENDVEKYSITKKYAGNKLSDVGQIIEVKLPFGVKEEPLANIDYIIKIGKIHGLELEFDNSFADYLDKIEINEKLSDGDKSVIDLTRYVTLRKTKEVTFKPQKVASRSVVLIPPPNSLNSLNSPNGGHSAADGGGIGSLRDETSSRRLRDSPNSHLSPLETEENPDFIDKEYDEKIDDQEHLIIESEEQTYLHKSYEKNVEYAFPKFFNGADIPKKYKGKTPKEIDKIINDKIMSGKDIHWTNKSLSYMRKDIQGKRLMRCVFLPTITKIIGDKPIDFIDTTANIGGTSLQYALIPQVRSAKSYDIDPEAIRMLKNNVELYGYEEKFTLLNKRFDYDFVATDMTHSLVISIDPPFEKANNPDNFNLSIENRPIYYVVEKLLTMGVSVVFLDMPSEFRYNSRYAKDNKQYISVYTLPTKNIKIYAISKHPSTGNFDRYEVVRDYKDKSEYSCKIIRIGTTGLSSRKTYFKKFEN